MGESTSQSRYGILDELSKRKVTEQGTLAVQENKLRTSIRDFEKTIAELEHNIKGANATYKGNHTRWMEEKLYGLKTKEIEFESEQKLDLVAHKSEVAQLKKEMDTRDRNYEQKHKDDLKATEENITNLKDNLKVFKEDQFAIIEQQKLVIAEIDKGIKSIKEISKDQA